MIRDKIIEEVSQTSPWVFNLIGVPKASGGLRSCRDFRALNKAIVRERYVIPKVQDTMDSMNFSN